jgi:glycosyltransferase involved in cell wall biosynthesis
MLGATRSPWGLAAFGVLVVQMGRAARRLARELDADVIHAHWWVPAGLAARLLGERPFVVTLHGTDVALLETIRPARWLAAWVLKRAAGITAVSSHVARSVSRFTGIEPTRIMVDPMPIDTRRFLQADDTRGAALGGGGVVTVGRITRQKRMALLIDAVHQLAAQGRPVPLTIVGDGPERAELERLVRGRGATDLVRFLGAVEPDKVPDILRNADLFAFPAVGEGLGLAVAEALMMGVPVVAARDGGGVVDIVPERGAGRLAAPDASSIAEAIREMLGDSEARAAAAEAGDVLRRRFAPDAVAAAFEAVYRRAVADGA